MRKIFALLLLALVLSTQSAIAATTRIEQKRQAESEHTELRKKLRDLSHDILKTESFKHRIEETLANSNAAIAKANRELSELDLKAQQLEQTLAALTEELLQLQQRIALQKTQLSTLLRQQYVTGSVDRVKLLLSGDNPNRINRDMQYFGYLSRGQNELIEALNANVTALEENKAATEKAQQALADIVSKQQRQKNELVREKAQRAELVQQLSKKLATQRQEAAKLKKDDQRLSSLVTRLNRVIDEERKRALLAAKKRQEKKAAASKQTSTALRNTQTPESESNNNQSAFLQLKGRLRLPVKGDIIARYGSTRSEGAVWKGLFISANEGDPIKSIAPGKVVFADTLRGFGNLIILDHGSQYMSIYGNNQTLAKQVGDSVAMGDVIATAGNTGSNEHSGLYFELRYQGKAFNPLTWVSVN